MRDNSGVLHLTKFLIVGLSNTLISYLFFIAFYKFILVSNAFLSQSISYAAGIAWSFYWNKNWTFSEKTHSLKVFIPFLTVQISLLFLSALLMYFATKSIIVDVNIIWITVMGLITMINFLCSKYLVFKI